MSRRPPNPAAERAAQNQLTIKSLLKLEANKVCADCKRNKHPRWASWNLGVFICIRCSGIHRGMGTHISRVKSVDLDSWTDEQLQSILSWGNARANKYWENKLATGHMPSEAKIENFIRTKYELKRWVMDGPMPDPASLDVEGDDDIPLSIVKEKQSLDRKQSLRKTPGSTPAASPSRTRAAPAPVIDLIGAADLAPQPPRSRSAAPTTSQVAPKGPPVPPKATASSAKDSLLGLDFLGSQPAAPARPSSTTGSGSAGQSRPDLKQSILSLYATAPRTQAAPAQQSFGGLGSPALSPGSFGGSGGAGGGLVDAFGGLSFSAAPVATSPKPVDAFYGLASMSHNRTGSSATAKASPSPAFGSLGGGGFFDTKPTSPAAAPVPKPTVTSSSSAFGGLGGFDTFASAPAMPTTTAVAPTSNGFGDLFDFSSSTPAAPTPAAPAPSSSISPPPGASTSMGAMSSVFNLSVQPAKPTPSTAAPVAPAAANPLAAVGTNWSNSDVWGSNDSWSTAQAPAAQAAKTQANDFGWGSAAATSIGTSSFATQSIVPGAAGGFAPAPKVAADEEFGGWTSSATTPAASSKPAAGFGGNDDLFSNVWG